jgi:hypothetical protein
MSMPHRLPDYAVRTDPWTLYCSECLEKMRLKTATPAQLGRETLAYECVCGHSESFDVTIKPNAQRATPATASDISSDDVALIAEWT